MVGKDEIWGEVEGKEGEGRDELERFKRRKRGTVENISMDEL
jgi:hypothetical protein